MEIEPMFIAKDCQQFMWNSLLLFKKKLENGLLLWKKAITINRKDRITIHLLY